MKNFLLWNGLTLTLKNRTYYINFANIAIATVVVLLIVLATFVAG